MISKKLLQNKKGVAGLNIFLAVISMLFMIGLIVMVFIVAATEMQGAVDSTLSGSLENDTLTSVDELGEFPTGTATLAGCVFSVDIMYNNTDGVVIPASNFTIGGCSIANSGDNTFNNTDWNVSGTFTYNENLQAAQSLNATKTAIATAIDFFDVIIVLAAMIVLILLVVIMINSIRGSGITGGA